MNTAAELFEKSLKDEDSLSFFTNDKRVAESLKTFLKENGIDYEPSECGKGIYFSVKATEEQENAVNDFLDKLFEEDMGDKEDEVP